MYNTYIEEADDAANKVRRRKEKVGIFMAGQRTTRRQKNISRLLREKKYSPSRQPKRDNPFPKKKSGK